MRALRKEFWCEVIVDSGVVPVIEERRVFGYREARKVNLLLVLRILNFWYAIVLN